MISGVVYLLRIFKMFHRLMNNPVDVSTYEWAVMAQFVWRLATGRTVRKSNPGGCEIFRAYPDRPWGPPSLLYNGYRVFPGGKAAVWLRR